MSRYANHQLALQNDCTHFLQCHFAGLPHCQPTLEEHLQYLQKMLWSTKMFCNLSGPRKEYVRGYEKALYDRLYDSDVLVFAYDVADVRYTITSHEYKQLSPKDVADHATWSGFVWADKPECVWSVGTIQRP